MIIGIICAMDEEIKPILEEMEIEKKYMKANMQFNLGKIYKKDIVAVRCGIGKVNAAVCTQILVDDFNVDKVINVGVAGGIGDIVYPGDVVIGSSLVQHDMDASAFGDKIGQIPRLDTFDFKCDKYLIEKAQNACEQFNEVNHYVGIIATGDQFIADIHKIKWINKEFDAIACEMEGGSIAQVCYLNNIPFIVIRSISDNANIGAHMDYEKFIPIAVKNSTNIIKYMIKSA
ncbi:5'-methylthioadenosine/S-adenosylhomocysteine nucleosidase [Clostridium acetireducens DSM 10703]|jgi:adenosylhomocysteine nucleosidase|uniref:adenosylhomocysteine nucleosidase n=1 Tax=Clostridium acetireducens DSM 10703 TaxID=1121290 RepID=A0A1E8F202_9CLOT|nr:5'-methylthioadenosine/adenosylhomocysteine nucleosidase [Clostridium acetireducens]OFI07562.1 5'-methylthioadenosine/S-adenosylhomocysteine nucleosidase [Clostridium acetireducens DSM 10703]